MASTADQRPTIDVHAHVVLEETFGTAGSHGPVLGEDCGTPWFRAGNYRLDGVRYRGSAFMDPVRRLAAMDEAGIDLQILSPNPLTYFHFIEARLATEFCARHNDVLATLVDANGERLKGFAALPMQDIPAAIAELERSVRELGLLGAYIGTDFGRALDDPALDEFYAAAVELDVPVFLHPAPAGIDGPPADPRLSRYDLDLTVGFAAEETLAVATLVCGGVLERHPQLDLCISHGGGGLAFLAGRLERATRVRPWASEALRAEGGFASQLARLWFDVHVHDPRARKLLADLVGPERLVLGTNFAGWDQGDAPVEDDWKPRLAENAARLLRLET